LENRTGAAKRFLLKRENNPMHSTKSPENAAVRVENTGSVRTIILHRPQARNAVDRPTAEALFAAFDDFDQDVSASVAVFWGAGGAFCAGADLKAIGSDRSNPLANPASEPLAPGPMGPSRMLLSKPVIAAISGPAVAGGLELALWCDMRVAEEQAVLGVFCRRWGVPLIDGGTIRLPRLIGHSRALDLILTGRAVHAAEALSMGLVNRVVPTGEGRTAAEALAHDIARFPQVCMRNDRMSAYEQWGLPLDQALAREFEFGIDTLRSGEAAMGAARFASGKGRGGDFSDI
jgi:enoyl-CoA hydratase